MNASNIKYEIRDDHIGIFDNFYDDHLIENYIRYFNNYSENFGTNFRNNRHVQDESIDLITGNYYEPLSLKLNYLTRDFLNIFYQEIYPLYNEKYQILRDMQNQAILDMKIQKTKPGQAYHGWHCENDRTETRDRICALMLYLNDVEDGGETEFLFQKTRIKPQKNRLLIWPAHFTHIHRGNQPISGDKYILTGWIEYC